MHRFHVERLNLKKLKEVESKEQYHVEISNRFTAVVKLDAEVNINIPLKTITEYKNFSRREYRLL
jgi:hypothetical protein